MLRSTAHCCPTITERFAALIAVPNGYSNGYSKVQMLYPLLYSLLYPSLYSLLYPLLYSSLYPLLYSLPYPLLCPLLCPLLYSLLCPLLYSLLYPLHYVLLQSTPLQPYSAHSNPTHYCMVVL